MSAGEPVADPLSDALEHVARVLPAQGPINVFIHHNTLHAFEDRDFDDAVVHAATLFGCEPYLSEAEYREAIASGRIRDEDLIAIVDDDIARHGDASIGASTSRRALRLAILRHGIAAVDPDELPWILSETDVLTRGRADLPDATRRRLCGARPEAAAVAALWDACVRDVSAVNTRTPPAPIRVRDRFMQATGIDIDEWVHPVLIAACAAFVDQGLAYWAMPGRELGFYVAFLRLYRQRGGPPQPWLRELERLAAKAEPSALASIRGSLRELGTTPSEIEPFLVATALALRGFAGMMRQLEVRPDRVPVHAPPAALVDFLAVRLLLERAALTHAARHELGFRGALADLREVLPRRSETPPTISPRAWRSFHAAQLVACDPTDVPALGVELDAFDDLACRRLLHRAYERRYRVRLLDALALHGPDHGAPEDPTVQAIFCIDEREESIRRHLEEVAPSCETFGTAGFFGVPMYFRGLHEAHARPSCPIAVRPQHEVRELPQRVPGELRRLQRRSRRALGWLRHGMTVGSRTFVRGTIITALLGALAVIPLVARVLFPRIAARLRQHGARLVGPPRRTRLALHHTPSPVASGLSSTALSLHASADPPSVGPASGFTRDEMVAIVHRQLVDMGLSQRFAPLVLVIGHGSNSLNNPHESAHDCGACGGGHGGPNARAFARMANDPDVRGVLGTRGLTIPATTWFVGAEHDSCDDTMTWFDLDEVPPQRQEQMQTVRDAFEHARRRNAQERCRRFEAPRLSSEAALDHVLERAQDLAQPRPEYGHATNASCIIGRRRRTRGLFLDRRSFLVSYDPASDDPSGAILGRVLQAIIPVVAGINLEYWFGRVDPVGYGCGTKLPHNITALLGVMDGYQSDLRTGLPWQMVEIHEPVRLLVVVETRPDTLTQILARDAALAALVRGGWIQLATLDPDTNTVHTWQDDALARHVVGNHALPVTARSRDWYVGKIGPLSPARIAPQVRA